MTVEPISDILVDDSTVVSLARDLENDNAIVVVNDARVQKDVDHTGRSECQDQPTLWRSLLCANRNLQHTNSWRFSFNLAD